jgi:heavy metal sensor kinase
MKNRLAIGVRLTLWYLLIFAFAQTIFGLGMWFILRHNLYDIADDALEAQVDDLQHFIKANGSQVSSPDLGKEIENRYGLEHLGEYLFVADSQGFILYRGPLVEKFASPPTGGSPLPEYKDHTVDRKPVRLLTDSFNIDSRQYFIQVGTREDDVLETLGLFRRYLLLFAPFLLLMAASGGYWLSRRALAPVDLLARTARNITGQDLSRRLERLHTGDELQRLSDTLNDMLARIETQFLRVSQFTADASHELRTPIALIRTEAEIVLRKSRDEAEYRDALQHVLLEAEKTSTLIETLLSLARADAGQEVLVMQPLDLKELSRTVAEEWRPLMTAKDLELADDLGGTNIAIAGDAAALNRLLGILLDNASKYTPAHGKIELILRKTGQTGVVKIRDNGIGISEGDQARIFERFYRADKARTRESGGVGLGLAIADWIVQQHRGHITLQSILGQGSTFTVEVPLYVP